MTPKIWIIGTLAGGLFACNAGCSVQRSASGVSVPHVGLLTPDTLSQVRLETHLQIPARSLSRRSRMIFQPMLVQDDGPVSRLPMLVLDAPIQTRKQDRRQTFSGQTDSLSAVVRRVNPARRIEIPYAATTDVPSNGAGGRIVARLSIHSCGRWVTTAGKWRRCLGPCNASSPIH